MIKNLCEDCKFLEGNSTNNCNPTEIHPLGQVLKCDSYKSKNVIKNIFIMIKKK
jgi:hypothetical protein